MSAVASPVWASYGKEEVKVAKRVAKAAGQTIKPRQSETALEVKAVKSALADANKGLASAVHTAAANAKSVAEAKKKADKAAKTGGTFASAKF